MYIYDSRHNAYSLHSMILKSYVCFLGYIRQKGRCRLYDV